MKVRMQSSVSIAGQPLVAVAPCMLGLIAALASGSGGS
jgi:hypothetical protein